MLLSSPEQHGLRACETASPPLATSTGRLPRMPAPPRQPPEDLCLSLTHLDLSGGNLRASELLFLEGMHMPRLQVFALFGNELGADFREAYACTDLQACAGARLLRVFSRLPALHELDLRWNGICDRGAAMLCWVSAGMSGGLPFYHWMFQEEMMEPGAEQVPDELATSSWAPVDNAGIVEILERRCCCKFERPLWLKEELGC